MDVTDSDVTAVEVVAWLVSVSISIAALWVSCSSVHEAEEANRKADSANAIARRSLEKSDTANAIARQTEERQQELNKPAIEVDFQESLPTEYRYETGWLLSLRGGPATIEWTELTVDDTTVGTWKAALEHLPIDLAPTDWTSHVPSEEHLYDPGGVVLFAVEGQFGPRLSARSPRVDLSVCYCSVIGAQCWIESTDRSPQKVGRCGSPPEIPLRSSKSDPRLELSAGGVRGVDTVRVDDALGDTVRVDEGGTVRFRLLDPYGDLYFDPDLEVGYYETSPPPPSSDKFGRVQLAAQPTNEEGYPARLEFNTPGRFYFTAEARSEEGNLIYSVLPFTVYVERKQQ